MPITRTPPAKIGGILDRGGEVRYRYYHKPHKCIWSVFPVEVLRILQRYGLNTTAFPR